MEQKLDAKTVARLELPEGKTEEIFWDPELKGCGYRLRQGRKHRLHRSWIAQYRADGRTRRATFSAEKLKPAEAREAVRQLLARVALGHDPQGEKQAKRQQATHTVRSVIDTYLDAKQGELRPELLRVTKLYLAGPYFRPLHPMAITAVTRADAAACIRGIIRRHSGPTAAAARRALSALFAWSIAEGLLGNGANPVDGSHRPADPAPRAHVLTPAELGLVWNCAGDDEFGKIIRLLILLGSRRGEVGGMAWSELDLATGIWVLPEERSKNHRSHTVTLPPAALEIIRSVPRCSRDQLFGDRAGEGFSSWSRCKLELDRRLSGRVKPWRIHDLRRTVATRMADDVGIEPHHVEAVLNHFSGHRSGIAGVYNRARYEIAIASALRRWSEHVLALVEGRKSNVIALQRA